MYIYISCHQFFPVQNFKVALHICFLLQLLLELGRLYNSNRIIFVGKKAVIAIANIALLVCCISDGAICSMPVWIAICCEDFLDDCKKDIALDCTSLTMIALLSAALVILPRFSFEALYNTANGIGSKLGKIFALC